MPTKSQLIKKMLKGKKVKQLKIAKKLSREDLLGIPTPIETPLVTYNHLDPHHHNHFSLSDLKEHLINRHSSIFKRLRSSKYIETNIYFSQCSKLNEISEILKLIGVEIKYG